MSYELAFHEAALKEWKKLGAVVKAQFKKQLAKRLQNPHVPSAKWTEPQKLDGDLCCLSEPSTVDDRAPPIQLHLDAVVVIVADVVVQSFPEFVDVAEFVRRIELWLERCEEAFHRRVVEAIPLARHARCDCVLLEKIAIYGQPILPAWVGMQDWALSRFQPIKRFSQH